ncbi:MAG: hypothetical protein QOE44_2880, partial [Solirubrobacteraceae bacterium]|nr:hypothetical protein [Solirubrobacteraceae bacterium]
MRRHFGASAVGLAIAGLLVAAPLSSGKGLLSGGGGDSGLNVGGRAAGLTGGSSSGLGATVSGLTGSLGNVVSGATGAVSGATGSAGSGPLSGVTGALSGATGAVSGVTNSLNGVTSGLTGTLTTTVGSLLSGTGLLGVLGAATPTAGSYQPPLHDIGNPHGEGTVATATIGANVLPVLPGGGLGGEVVIGRSLGEYQKTTTNQFHGHITVLSLFGAEILGVDSNPGQSNSGPVGTANKICADTAQTICLNLIASTSTTTNTSSINHFETAGVGIAGVAGLTADAAYSDGNISVDPVTGCETTLGDANATNVKLGALAVAPVTNSRSTSITCNDPTKSVAPSSISQVIGLLGTPLGLPILAPNPGCSSGGPATTAFGTGSSGTPNTDAGIPTLLPIICNADDTNGAPAGTKQDPTIPYTVREALTAFVLQLTPGTALAKVTAGASQASSLAPGAIGTTTATTATTAT